MSKSPRLDGIREAEEHNYRTSVARLGDTVSLVDDFFGAYEVISNLLRETTDPSDEFLVISLLFLASVYQLDKASLECLRGRQTDAIQTTRRAIELGAFSARIHQHPHLAEKWIDAVRSDTEYNDYKNAFRGKKIFPGEDKLLTQLGIRYDLASKQFHGSPQSMQSRLSIITENGALELRFSYFDVNVDNPAEPVPVFLWIIDTHLHILRVFERVFRQQIGSHFAVWETRRNTIEAKLLAHKERWRPVVFPEAGKADTELA